MSRLEGVVMVLALSFLAFALLDGVIFDRLHRSVHREDIIHLPPGGCPAGYRLVAEVFTLNGEHLPACVSQDARPGRATIDVLRPGESVAIEAQYP